MSIMGEGPLARFARIKHPVARDEDLLVEHLADETVVYDKRNNDAHCLSPLAAVVFAHCDGETTIEELAVLATERLGEPVDQPRVIDALAQLQERDLLAIPPRDGLSAVPDRDGLSRRQMLRKGAVVAGGVAFAAPLITTIVAPKPSAAASAFCTQETLCRCCEPTCFSGTGSGVQCNSGGNNCCEGHSCNCTGATSNGVKHCKPSGSAAQCFSDLCGPDICADPGP